MTSQDAEILGLAALNWLASNEELLAQFLNETGLNLADVQTQASDAAFLAGVLDFICMDDAWVIACASEQGLDPSTFSQARAALPGGDLPNWT